MKTGSANAPGADPARDVCGEVVSAGLCAGCGACAALCPTGRLRMELSADGEYRPAAGGPCTDCGRCLRACPFADGGDDEDALARARFGARGCAHDATCGYVLASLAGHVLDPARRRGRSSGGLASWYLADLLRSRDVDAVLAVEPTGTARPLFRYARLTTPEAVLASAKSAYYPVELSSVLDTVLNTPGRYALTGLPCVLKAVQRAAAFEPRLAARVTVYAGLVCGGLRGCAFTEYMARAAGIRDPAALRAVDYRRAPVRPPAAFFDAVFTDDGGRQRALNWSRGAYGGLWHDGCFKLRACDDCDDIFAELADAAFMDAWLPEYAADAAGTNLVLCRRPDALARFEDGARRGELHIEPVTLERVIESQRGLVYDKRGGLAGRLAAARRRGERMAVKRVAPAARLSVSDRIATALRERCRRAGRDTYRRTRCRGGAAGRWPLAAALAGPRAARRFWLALANVKRGLRPARQP